MDYAENDDAEISQNNIKSDTDDLKEIMKMYQNGLLTDEEFTAMKNKIINK